MQIRIKTYPKLVEYVQVFAKNALDLMIIEGTAGTGKSSIVSNIVRDGKQESKNCGWIEGKSTAAALYEFLYHHRDLPIVIDDVDGLYKDAVAVNLLKCLCQTWEEKRVMWNSMNRIKSGDTPSEFITTSKVCVITNSWRSLNKHVGAVQDRGLLIMFQPDTEEVHRYVGEDLKDLPLFDQEVYDFVGDNLHNIQDPSIRLYHNALQLKKAGVNWREAVIESLQVSEKEMCYLSLQKDDSLSENDRASLFAEMMDCSERTYWRVHKDMKLKRSV